MLDYTIIANFLISCKVLLVRMYSVLSDKLKVMVITVNPKIFEDFDNPRLAVIVVEGADNQTSNSDLVHQTNQLLGEIRQIYADKPLSQEPKIAAWREAHRKFGSKPKDYPSSIEALYKRILKGQDIGAINPLVDIYNFVSLKYMLPAGGEDLDHMVGDLELTYADKNEKPVVVLGKDYAQAPPEGEVIYKDQESTICRRWNWREVARTILTEKTKDCILVLEAIGPTTDKELADAQNELAHLVSIYTKAHTTCYTLDKHNPQISF